MSFCILLFKGISESEFSLKIPHLLLYCLWVLFGHGQTQRWLESVMFIRGEPEGGTKGIQKIRFFFSFCLSL